MANDRTARREEALGILLVVLGLLAVWFAVQWLPRWHQAAPELRVHLVVFLAAGIPAVLAGAACLAGRLVGLAGWAGGTAAAICGVNLLSGIALGSIPCGSPT
jgi:hypothetical protein